MVHEEASVDVSSAPGYVCVYKADEVDGRTSYLEQRVASLRRFLLGKASEKDTVIVKLDTSRRHLRSALQNADELYERITKRAEKHEDMLIVAGLALAHAEFIRRLIRDSE